MKSHSTTLAVFVLAVFAGVTPALAQEGGGLFGRRAANPNAHQKLDLTVSSSGEYNVDTASTTGVDAGLNWGGLQGPGYSGMLESAVDYAFRGRHVQFRTTGSSAQRYLRPLDRVFPATFSNLSNSGAVQFSAMSRKTSFSVSQTGVYSSSPLYGLLTASVVPVPGDAPAAPASYAISDLKALTYGTSAALTRQFARRSGLSVNVDWQHTDSTGQVPGRQQLDMYSAGVRLSHSVARDTTIAAGYTYRVGAVDQRVLVSTATRRLEEHGLQFGFDQRRRLSGARALTLSFTLGGAALLVPPAAAGVTLVEQGYNRVWGQANLGYDLARGWQVNAGYRQGIDYVPALSEPVLAKNFSAGMNGQITRRVDVQTSAAYSSGQTAVTLVASVFDTYTGNARLRFAVARSCATYVEYLYYFYDSRGTSPLVPGLPGRLERNTFRVGLMLRIPAL